MLCFQFIHSIIRDLVLRLSPCALSLIYGFPAVNRGSKAPAKLCIRLWLSSKLSYRVQGKKQLIQAVKSPCVFKIIGKKRSFCQLSIKRVHANFQRVGIFGPLAPIAGNGIFRYISSFLHFAPRCFLAMFQKYTPF